MKTGQKIIRTVKKPQSGLELLAKYNRGYSTETELVLRILSLTDKKQVIESLKVLPPSIQSKVKQFVGYYRPKTRIFRGPTPDMRTVGFARVWLEANLPPANGRRPSKSAKRKLTKPVAG